MLVQNSNLIFSYVKGETIYTKLWAVMIFDVVARSMALLVSFHSQCRGVKFYDLRSAGAEWGTKLKLVKESTNPHVPGIGTR